MFELIAFSIVLPIPSLTFFMVWIIVGSLVNCYTMTKNIFNESGVARNAWLNEPVWFGLAMIIGGTILWPLCIWMDRRYNK